jgi:hypothetical protein
MARGTFKDLFSFADVTRDAERRVSAYEDCTLLRDLPMERPVGRVSYLYSFSSCSAGAEVPCIEVHEDEDGGDGEWTNLVGWSDANHKLFDVLLPPLLPREPVADDDRAAPDS